MIDVAPGASPVCPACGFGSGSGSAPSPMVTGPTSPPVQPMMSPPDAWGTQPGGFSQPMGMPPQQKTSGKAIAALVLGIVSVCIAVYLGLICGIIGLVLGIMGMKEIDRNPQTMKGKGMAIAGIVLGAVGILLQVIFLLIFGLAFASIFECIENPEAEGCEDFQDPDAQVTWSAPAMAVGPAWSGFLDLAGSPARPWAS